MRLPVVHLSRFRRLAVIFGQQLAPVRMAGFLKRPRSAAQAPPRAAATAPRVLFICGSLNQTTQMHAVARALPEVDAVFSPFYGPPFVQVMRELGLAENTIGGHKMRRRCLAYLEQHGLAVDEDGERGGYDLVVACTDLALPTNLQGIPIVVVQEGMTDPDGWISRIVQASRVLPLWLSSTALTGLSGGYARFCVASEGYRDYFAARGAPVARLVVTGIPNFDDCKRYRNNSLPYRGYVLACTSDLRETYRRDDRAGFIERVRAIAEGRPIHFKLHPNERVGRSVAEIRERIPDAVVHVGGSAEELIANCDVLVAQYSSVVYVGIALEKEVHSYYDHDELLRLCPIQNGGRSAANIADVCRELLAMQAVGSASTPTGLTNRSLHEVAQ